MNFRLSMNTTTPDYKKELFAWAQDPQRLHEEPEELLYTIVNELTRLGLEPGLGSVAIRTPHPQLDVLVMRWRPLNTDEVPTTGTASIRHQQTIKRSDGVLDLYPLAHGHVDEAMWRKSPFYKALESNQSVRVRLNPPPSPVPFPIVDDLVTRGMTDYVVFPLASSEGVSVVVSIATLKQGGFPDAFIAAFDSLIPILSLSVAYKVERFQFQQVLSAYIGREPATRVLNGQIRQGDFVTRRAAIGFADLRGFTAATARLETEALLSLLGAFFEQVGSAIHASGGEILKFMGDGVLFVFADEGDATKTCNRALGAVNGLTKSVDTYNENNPNQFIRFGCALHFGEVLYGNIGTPSRLDFTVLGHAVNFTSRLESLTGQLDEVCLLSETFAELTTEETSPVGTFKFKGLDEPQVVYRSMRSES